MYEPFPRIEKKHPIQTPIVSTKKELIDSCQVVGYADPRVVLPKYALT
jgi:hypothetical protein